MVRLPTANSTPEPDSLTQQERALRHQQAVDAASTAEARRLDTVYRVSGTRNPHLDFGGLLTERMQASERTIRELITTGRLGYYCAGKKAYRVSERAVRRFEAGLPPLTVPA